MIKINNKEQCCGCAACVQKCPKHCISFEEDKEGFYYPVVNEELCVDCGLCEKVCPVTNARSPKDMPQKVYAYKNENIDIRYRSSSGGFFTTIAETIIDDGGVVFGARFDNNWRVVHGFTETKEGLKYFRGSKYVQSFIGNSFKQVEEFLKLGKKVLFSGTPCQISALYLFLRKDYENLYTMDFVCHGVPSPGIFKWYLQERINEVALLGDKNSVSFSTITSIPKGDILIPNGIEIKDIRFRDKCTGWKKYSFALYLVKASADGEKIQLTLSKDCGQDFYLKGFIGDLYLRPSCYNCTSKSLSSNSDFTVADFWGQEDNVPEFDNDTGVSAILMNTDKAKFLISHMDGLHFLEMDFQTFFQQNPSIVHCVKRKRVSVKFWNLYGKYSFTDTISKTYKRNATDILYKIIDKILI